jgi:hypothetical protein
MNSPWGSTTPQRSHLLTPLSVVPPGGCPPPQPVCPARPPVGAHGPSGSQQAIPDPDGTVRFDPVAPEFARPGYRQPPPSPPAPQLRRRNWPRTLALVALLLGGGGVGVGAALGWFTHYELDASAVQAGVQQILIRDYHVAEVGTVTCPAGEPVVPGTAFTCQAVIAGTLETIHIRVLDAGGAYRVAQP